MTHRRPPRRERARGSPEFPARVRMGAHATPNRANAPPASARFSVTLNYLACVSLNRVREAGAGAAQCYKWSHRCRSRRARLRVPPQRLGAGALCQLRRHLVGAAQPIGDARTIRRRRAPIGGRLHSLDGLLLARIAPRRVAWRVINESVPLLGSWGAVCRPWSGHPLGKDRPYDVARPCSVTFANDCNQGAAVWKSLGIFW